MQFSDEHEKLVENTNCLVATAFSRASSRVLTYRYRATVFKMRVVQ